MATRRKKLLPARTLAVALVLASLFVFDCSAFNAGESRYINVRFVVSSGRPIRDGAGFSQGLRRRVALKNLIHSVAIHVVYCLSIVSFGEIRFRATIITLWYYYPSGPVRNVCSGFCAETFTFHCPRVNKPIMDFYLIKKKTYLKSG